MSPVRSRGLLKGKANSNPKIKDLLTILMNSRKIAPRPTSNGMKWRFKSQSPISHPSKTSEFRAKNELEDEVNRNSLNLKRSFAAEIQMFNRMSNVFHRLLAVRLETGSRVRRRRSRTTSVTKHYTDHKEAARKLINARLEHFNTHYNLKYKRVAIRNQRRSWGSCTSLGNLNFSYKILFLPPELADYIVVHELCHLKELNHSERFWNLVAEIIPDYHERKTALKKYDHLHPFKLALLARERESMNIN